MRGLRGLTKRPSAILKFVRLPGSAAGTKPPVLALRLLFSSSGLILFTLTEDEKGAPHARIPPYSAGTP